MVQAPNAYDLYLDGMDLVERWDKDDNLEKAIGLFREATDLDPGFALAFARLADSQRIQYAITRDTSWLALATENVKEAVRLNPDLAPVQVVLGRIRASQGNLDLAFAALERALEIDPNDAAANQSMAKLYERQGKLQDAEDLFRKAVMLDPEDLLIRDSYANFLFRQGRFEDASEQWRTVIRYASDHFGALVNLGSALNEMGKVSEAITFYERAIEIKPSYMAYANLGTAYSRSGHYSKSVEVFKKALEIEDSDWLTWGNLAYTYSWMDGMEELAAETFEHAIQLAEEGRKQNPRDAFANSDLALYYVKTGQEELALQRAQTAITLSPDTGEILAAAAEVYELLGQRDKAIELVQKALDLGHPAQIIQRNPEFADLLEDERMKGSP
jgi:serine/threonine-protein kinase